jgi:hypothetical protein
MATRYRTVKQVADDIEHTRDRLILADTAQLWDEGDEHLAHLRELWAEYAAIPHPRLPSDSDGHRRPQAY